MSLLDSPTGKHPFTKYKETQQLLDFIQKNDFVNYDKLSHRHCWNNENNPCGIPLEKHAQCCLCNEKYNPMVHSSKLKELTDGK